MRRIPRLTARFLSRRQALGIASGSAASAVTATIAELIRSPLPGPEDFETLMPPVVQVWCRRVPGFNFWLFYNFSDAEVVVITVTARPPIPLDK
ncbi:MAG TPA: hypothetical protein VGJ84_07455 [Polyangiaceae bacterium]|jgi:Txe/YoeB family toxin of Txe-Axe toxin-antitoxin module